MSKVLLNKNFARFLVCSSFSILLTACGGGGGSSGSDPAQASADAAAATGAAGQSAGSTSGTTSGNTTTGATGATGSAKTGSTTTSGSTSTNSTSTGSTTTGSTSTSSTAATPYGQDATQYTALTFDEEFNGSLNTSVWNDHAWYETSNATKNYSVGNGTLNIWPQKDSTGNFFNRTIDTDGKFYQTYGYFEIEAKLPIGKGTWPAFWLFNHIGTRRPEIDIMEAYAGGTSPWGTMINGQPHPTMYATTIWKDATVQAGMQKVSTGDLSTGFHKWGIKWEPTKQTYYFDGKQVFTLNVSMPDPMYIMLDLWFGSASGTPDSTTPTGSSNAYQVNYVRAWQLKS
jgi:beta-glucanase (GH16 family)